MNALDVTLRAFCVDLACVAVMGTMLRQGIFGYRWTISNVLVGAVKSAGLFVGLISALTIGSYVQGHVDTWIHSGLWNI